MGKSSFTPNARNTDRPQPEVCQVTGDLTPSQDLIVADVEGLRGAHIGSTYPWLAKVRLRLAQVLKVLRGRDIFAHVARMPRLA